MGNEFRKRGDVIRKTALGMSFIIFIMALLACHSKAAKNGLTKDQKPVKRIEDVLKEHTDELMSVPGVVGTASGLCNRQPCIKVFVTQETPELKKKIPSRLEGYPVVIEETGEIRPL